MKDKLKKSVAVLLTATMVATPITAPESTKKVQAEQLGSIAKEVTGTWSYWDGNKDVVQTNKMLLDKLPTRANQGTYRFTTDNYDANTNAIDVGGFSSSMLWNYNTSAFGECVYAIPMAYCGNTNGMYVSKPSTLIIKDTYTQTVVMSMNSMGTMSDFIVGTDYTFASTKVDKSDEWLTDVVMENANDSSQYLKTTMVQGSPFAYFQVEGGNTITLQRPRTLPSEVAYYNGTTLEDSTQLIIRVYDNADLISGYSDYDYYAVYLPEGTKVSQADATAKYADNKMGDLTFTLPSDRAYMSMAWLMESNGKKDADAQEVKDAFAPYAYNFITGTKTSFTQNGAEIKTTYKYTVDKKAESTADGTVMGILPHQYKNMSGYDYMDYTARTIRGTMKYLIGDSYQTTLQYTGILPTLPGIDESDKATLQGYVNDFMDVHGPTDDGGLTKESYEVNTYDTGKKLNRAIQVMEAAEACGDTQSADKLLKGIENELADWFTADGEDDDKYFYYDKEVGSLFGFPQAYYTVDGMTDHHFHYGYFVNAAAQVAMRDAEFIKKYENVINEIIGDFATYEENNSNSRYPFLRYFSTYEGHSWASGHANFGDGNNQESSSEAINAWAGLILYGQATGNKELTSLGMYLYATEVSSVNCYWFDTDGDILDEQYTEGKGENAKYSQASMVWGGKYTYAAWWTDEPLQIQGINILPMTSASFYAATNKDFILTNWKTAERNEKNYNGKNEKNPKRWNEIWSEYLAMADPDKALEYFDEQCDPEAGESKAHAFNWIMAMQKNGTPDLTVTSDNPLACAFKNADGEMTYVAYNTTDEDVKVSFSDGTEIVAKPHSMTTTGDGEVTTKSTYKVEHYLSDGNGNYNLFNTEKKSGKIGNEVTAIANTYQGYKFNPEVEGTVQSGVIAEDGSLVLKLYYDITEIETTKEYEDDSEYTSLGVSNGVEISYRVLRNDFNAGVKLLDANDTFYMEYQGIYTSENTNAYLNKKSLSTLNGVFKFSVKNTLTENTYNTIKLVSGNKQVYILVKYGKPTTAPDLSDYESEQEETTVDENAPTDATGLVLGTPADNVISVTFRATQEQNDKGQLYNVYVDGTLKLSSVAAGNYTIDKIYAGTRTVEVKAVLNGKESKGISSTIKVTGEKEPTTKPETTTKNEVTTTKSDNPGETTGKGETPGEVTTNNGQGETTKAQSSDTTTRKDDFAKTTVTSQDTINGQNQAKAVKVSKAKIKSAKITKKASVKKLIITFKKINNISGYQVKLSSSKKFAKKATMTKLVKKNKKSYIFKVSSKNLAKAKKLYVKARAYRIVDNKRIYGKWTKKKVVKK